MRKSVPWLVPAPKDIQAGGAETILGVGVGTGVGIAIGSRLISIQSDINDCASRMRSFEILGGLRRIGEMGAPRYTNCA
jgi:hypothetical protein